MAGNLIHQNDLVKLNDYTQVLRTLPAVTRSFKVNFDLVPAREYGSYQLPEIAELLRKASQHLLLWPRVLTAIEDVHRELEIFLEHIMQSAEGIRSSEDVTQPFIEQSRKRLSLFFEELDVHLETLIILTQGIYQILPRISDFINHNIYRHAHQYNLLEKNGNQNAAMQHITASFSFAESGPALSPQARLNGARHYLLTVQRQYVEAYGAACNMNACISQLSDLLWTSVSHTMRMTKGDQPYRPYLETRLMLVSLREAQRMAQWFNSLTGHK